MLPTSAVPHTTDHLAPYAYLVWFLPVDRLARLGPARARGGGRSAACSFFLLVTLVIVDGLGQFGPLRWPLRLQPFLVEAVAVAVAVTWTRFGQRRPSPRRLAVSLAWVVTAWALSVRWVDARWRDHLVAVVVVAAGLVVLWVLVRAGRTVQAALAAGFVHPGRAGRPARGLPRPPVAEPLRRRPTLRRTGPRWPVRSAT